MNWQALAPWIAPIATGFVLYLFGKALPGLIVTAIDGKFSEFRNEEVARMAAHNENENSHPYLRVVSDSENRIERAIAGLREEFLASLEELRAQIQELREGLNPSGPIQKKKRR